MASPGGTLFESSRDEKYLACFGMDQIRCWRYFAIRPMKSFFVVLQLARVRQITGCTLLVELLRCMVHVTYF
jgi:hypothetical protein